MEVCLPLHIRNDNCPKHEYMTGSIRLRGHSAGTYSGMVWETIMTEFPGIKGETILASVSVRRLSLDFHFWNGRLLIVVIDVFEFAWFYRP